MKGKVDSVTTKLTSKKQYYNVSINIILKNKLTYDDSEKLATELREQYLGKEVDINLPPNPLRKHLDQPVSKTHNKLIA